LICRPTNSLPSSHPTDTEFSLLGVLLLIIIIAVDIDMASKSPMKTKDIEKMVKSTVSVDTTPEGKVVYSLAEK
jgi:hypothetical protein